MPFDALMFKPDIILKDDKKKLDDSGNIKDISILPILGLGE